jgi:eukaryotic-like serine/threonine-protein kinase
MPETVGPYQVIGKLGAGGMGEVYKALDPRVGRQVALKILPESLATDPERRRRFEQEARLAASLNHPNIMAIYDVGLDQHPPYIIAELVPGESLRALISKGPLPPRKAIDIAAQIAAGLAAAHTAGIVHRDLKPENVIVTPEGTAKILDFGVARLDAKQPVASDATRTIARTAMGSIVGTAAYMSPEQARGQEVDHRSDQFSLGLVLYEMLSGKPAFERPSAVQTMSAIVEDEPPPMERTLPAQLRYILQHCLAKERGDRYESTRDLARELVELRDHYSEFTQTGVQPAVTTSRRRSGGLVAALIIAAVAAGWCAAQLLRDQSSLDLSRYTLTPFATELPTQLRPSWSPDSRSIAFFGVAESGPTQLYVQSLDAPTAVAISGGSGVSVHGWPAPFWSADSRSVYFGCEKGADWGICRAPAGGGETIVVQREVQVATLSPDGRTLAMLMRRSESGGRLRLVTSSPPEAGPHLYEPQPFEPGINYNNPNISFSRDGKEILVAIAFQGRGETAYLAPWPSGKARPLFRHGFPFSFTPEVSWMPDSRYFVFASSSGRRSSEIYMSDARSGRYWPIFVEDRGPSAPSVSPDGTRLAYQSNLSQADVIAVPLDDGPVRTLLGSFRTEEMADASPVSQQLVYATDRRGVQEVWISSLAEGWDRPLFTPENFRVEGAPAQLFLSPVFSPDGRRVAVSAMVNSRIHVYTAFVSGGTPVRATTGAELEDAPAWSPDGQWLAFQRVVNNSLKLSKVRPGSGEPPVDIGTAVSNPIPAWSPTGEWIAASGENGVLTLFSPDGKLSRVLPGGDGGPVVWSRDGKTLYHLHVNPPALSAIDIATGRERKLRDLPGLAPYSSLNPGLQASFLSDGKSIVYTVNRPRQEIWILNGLQEPRPWYMRLFGK